MPEAAIAIFTLSYIRTKTFQDIHVRVVALVNDTVGTQVATAFEYGQCDLGVIVGMSTKVNCDLG